VRLRPVGADWLSLALLQAKVIDDPRPAEEDEYSRGDHGTAGAHRQISEQIEDVDLIGEEGKPIEHGSAFGRSALDACRRRRVTTRILTLQRLDDRPHPRSERALDHDGIARTDSGDHIGLQRARALRIAAPALRGKGLPQRTHEGAAAED